MKDLRIEEGPAAPKENQPPPMPDDPAIVGVSICPTLPSLQSLSQYDEIFSDVNTFICLKSAKPHVDISVAFLLIWSSPQSSTSHSSYDSN